MEVQTVWERGETRHPIWHAARQLADGAALNHGTVQKTLATEVSTYD